MISQGGKARSEGGCMTLLGAEVVIRAQESGVPGGRIPLELCSGQVGGFYGCQDTAEVPKVCQGVQGTDHLPEHVLGDGEGRVVVPEGDRGSVEGPDEGGDDGQLQEDASQHVHVQGVGGGRVMAPGGDGGVRNVRGRHDQHHVGQEGVTGGCVPGGEGGEADDVHTCGDGQELQTSSRTTTFQSSISRKPKPMYFLKKRNIIPDGLVQKRLFDFKKQFPNLEENILTPNRKNKLQNYTNNVGDNDMGGLTNRGGAAHQRKKHSTNGEPGSETKTGTKRKVEPDTTTCKRRRADTDCV